MLAVIVNLITIAVVTGFQQEVRQKVSGFGSHLFIMSAGDAGVYEAEPIREAQPFYEQLKKDKQIKTINPVGYKPVLFQSEENEVTYKLPDGTDTTEIQQNVLGAIIKGVGSEYNLNFYKQNLRKGKLPQYTNDSLSNEILISKKLADDLGYKVNDEVDAFFVRKQPVKRKFKVVGIYETGLEEFDKKTVIGDLKYVQELNDWGIKANIVIEDTTVRGNLIVKADITGGNGNYRCDWGNGFESFTRFVICPFEDTTIRLIASDYWSDIRVPTSQTTLPDTAYLKMTVKGAEFAPCNFQLNELNELDKKYVDNDPQKYYIFSQGKSVLCEAQAGSGTSNAYVGGFEVELKNWDDLDAVAERIRKQIDFKPTPFDEVLIVQSIKQIENEIFVWLGFLDINVLIILVLMILIGIINMGSALLVLILVRTNFIGILKSMGANNWSIRKIFLTQAAFLIGKGMLWGNAIGLAICFLQTKFGFLSLNPDVYYLSKVPIDLHFSHWLLLNAGTLIVCLISLILPSIVITRIKPAKAIRFE